MQTLAPSGPAPADSPPPPVDRPRLGRLFRPRSLAGLDWLEVGLLIGVTAFVVALLRPGLLFGPNMDVGGDTAAHVAAVYYLVHHLLPEGQVSGWDPQWFGGFPLYVFYFPLPAVLVALLNSAFPYAVAFKLVTVLGTVTLPAAAYLFGRLVGFRRPAPILMAAAMVPFLCNWSYTIDGGNIASTLAGEFSYSLGCTTGLLFLGCVGYALRTGRLRWLAALLLGITVLCHVVPALFFSGAAVILTLLTRPIRGTIKVLVPIGVVGCLVAAFWLFRFGADLRYTSSMNYARVGDPLGAMLPVGGELTIQILAGFAAVIAVVRRDRVAIALAAAALGAAFDFWALPSGLVWNPRWLPFWFLTTALLAGYGIAEIGALVARALRHPSLNSWVTAPLGSVASVGIVAAYVGVLPFYATPGNVQLPLQSWVAWNYSGYQSKSGWPEFSRIVSMLDQVGKRYGCGRLDYEYTPNVSNSFGSTIVEMSFPMWTNGCISSSEGVYFESSTSTPFHFLDQSELSVQASNPVVGLPYQSLDVADGIAHLQLTGVNYFLANSALVEGAADHDPALQRIASTPENPTEVDNASVAQQKTASWVLYRVRNTQLVAPLQYEPVVEGGMSKNAWLTLGIRWYQQPGDLSVPIAESGPATWQRIQPGELVFPAAARRLPRITVSDIVSTDQSVSFHVSRTGVPVLVKVPYFPNWQATGATGPVEVTPNDMVVVPTKGSVTLNYGTTRIDWVGRVGSLVGLGGLVVLRRPVTLPEPAPPPRPFKPSGEPLLLESDDLVGLSQEAEEDDAPPVRDEGDEPTTRPIATDAQTLTDVSDDGR